MIRRLLLSFICLLVFCQCSSKDTFLHQANGTTVSMNSLKDKWVLLNYWAGWCENCRKESSELNDFFKSNTDKNIKMFGVNYDGLVGDDLLKQIKSFAFNFPVIVENPAPFFHLNPPNVLPVTFVIGPGGRLRDILIGPQTAKSIRASLNKLAIAG